MSNQITELKRQEVNLIKIAATSQEVNSLTLDCLLLENNKSQSELIAYKAALEAQRLRADTLEDDLIDVAERLVQLGDRIEQASFEERRCAVEELVKEILVQSQTVEDNIIAVITLTYRFNEPCQEIVPPPAAVVPDYTPAVRVAKRPTMCISVHAGGSITHKRHVGVRLLSLPNTKNVSPALYSTVLIFISKSRVWIMIS